MTAWEVNEEETMEVSRPPKTEHEKEAAKKAVEEVRKSLGENARKAYETDVREAVQMEKSIRELESEKKKLLKGLNMTQEDLNKLV